MAIAILSAAWDAEVPGTEKLVLLALADHADSTGRCWPSMERLGQRCGLSRSSILRSLRALQEGRHVEIVGSYGRCNQYLVHPIGPATCVTLTPVSDRHLCQPDTCVTLTPVSHRHPTSVTLTPHLCQPDTPICHEPVINRSERARASEPVSHRHLCQPDTCVTLTPVSDRHLCHPDTGQERKGRPEGLERLLARIRTGLTPKAGR